MNNIKKYLPEGGKMAAVRWVYDNSDYDKQRLDRASVESVRRYFQGFKFNMINRGPVYKDEFNDLEIIYKKTLEDLHKKTEERLPFLLANMQEFLTLHKQSEAIREKLDVLLAKISRKSHETCDDDCGGSDE